jgi:hypothetical protein
MHDAATTQFHGTLRASWRIFPQPLLLMVSLLLAFGIAGCGSDSGDKPAGPAAGEPTADELATVSATLYPDRTFTLEDFTAGGWKKSKQFATDTVPGSTDIWYGFYAQKDIEIRFYPSHAEAVGQGAESAASAIDQKFREGGQVGASNRGAGSSAVTKYAAFVVLGNTVALCELNLETCTTFAEAMAGS